MVLAHAVDQLVAADDRGEAAPLLKLLRFVDAPLDAGAAGGGAVAGVRAGIGPQKVRHGALGTKGAGEIRTLGHSCRVNACHFFAIMAMRLYEC